MLLLKVTIQSLTTNREHRDDHSLVLIHDYICWSMLADSPAWMKFLLLQLEPDAYLGCLTPLGVAVVEPMQHDGCAGKLLCHQGLLA